ncbi:MAG: Gfo/Idh/MocA family oxidoreductase [Verrucomicrobia bacterium]|nr:Gfo/Idh/MocA family oxidoreductase [Verrucomicrobiota bacterium]
MNETSPNSESSESNISRRHFLRHSSLALAGAAAASQVPFVITSHAAPDDPIRIGVIGCGGRGTGAVLNALGAATKVIYPGAGYHTEDVDKDARITNKGVQVVALADLFKDRLGRCRENLQALQINIPDDHCFTGFDAHKQLLALPDVNYVILATPPHFRPMHLKAAIEAGKHAFIEKPCAVDAPGVRMVMAAGELAKQKHLGIVAGTQRRHERSYQEAIKRIRDGAIGDIIYGRCYWNGGEIWVVERQEGWSDMEWQCRNWNYFTWLGGDHIVEQHVHNLDIMNWAIGTHPLKATALGGRQVRIQAVHGHIFDHFAVEFEYPNGVRMFSQCRQMNGCEGKVEEAILGTKGTSNCHNWIKPVPGEIWRFRGQQPNPYDAEHQDLIDSIRAGQPLNEAQAVAESTLTGIMGRESAYSGQSIEWEKALESNLRLGPEKYEFGALPVPPVAIPGKYRFS